MTSFTEYVLSAVTCMNEGFVIYEELSTCYFSYDTEERSLVTYVEAFFIDSL